MPVTRTLVGIPRLFGRLLSRVSWARHKRSIRRQVRLESISLASQREGSAPAEGWYLFYSPEADAAPHYSTQCLVARTLQELGHRVLFVRCLEVFDRCPAIENAPLPYPLTKPLREQICYRCCSASLKALKQYRLPTLDLRSLRTPEMTERIEQAIRQAPRDLMTFEHESIPFGRMTLMNVILRWKILDFHNVDETVRSYWLAHIRSAMLSYYLTDAICRRLPVRALVHHNDYPICVGARAAAKRHGVASTSVSHPVHRGVDRSRYMIAPAIWSHYLFSYTDRWPEWRELALPPAMVREISDDIIARSTSRGSHIYSAAKTIEQPDFHQRLGLSADKKLIVAFTSSLDEMQAIDIANAANGFPALVYEAAFADQVAWLKAVMAHVERHSDLQLVVRVHPREGRNKRDSRESAHLQILRENFSGQYERCRMVWPEDATSSYDLAEIADAALVSWSTIGLEMARLGIPVLTHTLGYSPYPNDDFIVYRGTPASYFRELTAMLARSAASLPTIARAFRGYHTFHLALSVDVGDVVPSPDFIDLPEFRLPREARTIELALSGGQQVLETNLRKLRQEQDSGSPASEERQLRTELQRIVHFIFTGEVPPAVHDLGVRSGPPSSSRTMEPTLWIEGKRAWYTWQGRQMTRYSPLCARLAPILTAVTGRHAAYEGRVFQSSNA